MAGVSGMGHLIIIAATLRWMLGAKDQLKLEVFSWMGNFLMYLSIAYIYFMGVELLTSTYAGYHHEVVISAALLSGEYAWLFWSSLSVLAVSFVLLVWQFLTGHYRLWVIVLCGVLVNVAALGKRYLIVVPSQTHGTLLPYGIGSYSPTWVEYSVILGLLAFGALLYTLFVKLFPIMEIPEYAQGGR
jgi:molybdopterin-containing oxidoreductase family membrane subunit